MHKETALLKQGGLFVAGLDEAGRGAWAGPVTAGAVILPLKNIGLVELLAGLNDSKKLSQKRREQFFDLITKVALAFSVGLATPKMVDELNVIGATRYAMRQALDKLTIKPDYLLIDHLSLPTINLPQQAFPKADTISLTVAAASVVAKVSRDRLMVELHKKHPAYGFDQHKGYGTQLHRLALLKYGHCSAHRLSYKPVRAVI